MKPVYLDLHIHTSENEDDLNQSFNVDALLDNINKVCHDSTFLISLTDHNTINKSAYLNLLSKTKNVILGVELHVWGSEKKPPYHCHIYFDFTDIDSIKIDEINKILDSLYPKKKIQPPYEEQKKLNIEDIIRHFDQYDFLLLPHGGQSHSTFDKSVDSHFDTRLEKSLYYNQFDGFTARNQKGLKDTTDYFIRLGINEFVNLVTCSDNYHPEKYPNAKADDASPFIPTWMFAEPTFNGLRLSLSESSRLKYAEEKPITWAEYIQSVDLHNEYIEIDVKLSPGLNVIIGDSSSGKTLFVDTLVCKAMNNFSKSNYLNFEIENVIMDNPSSCVPHYINQNYIIELISKNRNDIDKIDLIKKIFPDDADVSGAIRNAKSKLEQDINSLITYVEQIEKAEKEFRAIPILNRLIPNTSVQNNPIELLVPSDKLLDEIQYPQHTYEQHLINLSNIKEFMEKNRFIDFNNQEIEVLANKLEVAYKLSTFENSIRDEIIKTKSQIDTFFLEVDKETHTKQSNFQKLIQAITLYTDNLKKFTQKLSEIQKYSISLQSKTIESMGHKLFIEYTFSLNKYKFLEILNSYLKTPYKIDNIDNLKPSDLYEHKYKDSPKVENYSQFKQKVYSSIVELDQRKYKIETKDGRDFDSLSAGWKTSVLLDLILGYKDDNAPLIIDQPEDNLANSYINKGLIEAIKQVKQHKQIIIVSHNATIPMLGDAQTIVLCENIDNKLYIKSSTLEGTINDKKVVDHIASITDGGKSSIKKRVKKYNMKNFKES